ncbi:MAG: TauD/TfdA family dioxygenase [Candidatus Thiodiazotropha sp. (ex Lucinoma aequizonata)]|nr:TauD/TfdA family dioxygenase [Candidatus Thiodiazotropha sp. (ex Lucinoma aequizonata)]MCU7888304.1 TauD/TfdA family dioxygenase [Candidatus Thiodiazotropha sp. (ex Lucinoma aequizonata)]MCU7895817.1 TauD/TfdA family dioxygenase [Candidatus Thiodiazotropha sp. (ex Lucinoma aequizonata)]MCU7898296.1 TauD/TfdA family dioxygenase [Candidatus Thiodiazotropha sp. (ex Lucinoma aequizonata)]MCU7900965.1 TauD/TfdA family dioxygenase [Candidatus Thiodiazotropha sp. (ex Lucinoma aequizonata)]
MPTKSKSYFNPENQDTYAIWRDKKLDNYPKTVGDLVVELRDPRNLSQSEYDKLLSLCQKANMAIWSGLSWHDGDKSIIADLGLSFCLNRLDHSMCADNDAITSLTVQSDALQQGYIPYSNRPIAWHTDGYYNAPDQQIQGLLLHCVNPADKGGENDLFDHEILFIQLMSHNPDYIHVLMHPQAMTIPANIVDGKELRPTRTGPVFAIYPDGHLHMRYTDRSRSIKWMDDPLLKEAISYLKSLLKTPSPWHFHGKLEAGQGLICNNVLHTRSGFTDGSQGRLLYRARYYDRIHHC